MEPVEVSIIIPTFNRRQSLIVALDSVFQQPNVRVECIVIDDGSTDDTVASIREQYSNQALVVITNPHRRGAQASRNAGIAAARGEFIALLDSDDYFEPQTLASRVQLFREQNLDAVFSGYRVRLVGRRWDLVKTVTSQTHNCPVDYRAALLNFKIAPTSSIMYRRGAYPDLKLDEQLASGHDDDLSLYLIRNGRFAFDDILSMSLVQHTGDHVATPRNLMIGDAQLLHKNEREILQHHGLRYLTRRRAHALAGLWSVGQFRRSALLRPSETERGSMALAVALAAIYFPIRAFALISKRMMTFAVFSIL